MTGAILKGGAGFLGSHAGEALLAAGHNVAIIDDLNDFYGPAIKIANIASFAIAVARVYRADIGNKAELSHVSA